METVILVSVLCTLGVVAMVSTIVVAFMKLNRKVDDRENSILNEFERVYKYIKEGDQSLSNEIGRMNDKMNNVETDIYRSLDSQFQDCHSFIDKRCDKLDNKICGKNCKCNPNGNQLLTD